MLSFFSLRNVLACAALLLGAPPASCADNAGAYTFRSYGPAQGLRNPSVTGLAQDKDGFIFASTEDGLFRYDGNRFERFGTENGLLSDTIIALYQESGGRLWIMSTKGAQAWAGNRPDPAVTAVILPTHTVVSIAASGAGYLLVGTTDGIFAGPPDHLALVAALPQDGPGAVWVAPDGAAMLAAVQGKLYRRGAAGAWSARALPAGFRNEAISTVMQDARGRIWVRSHRMLLRLASFDGAEQDLSAQLPGASMLKAQLVSDAHGRVWAPTNQGLVRFDDDGVRSVTERQGLPTIGVTWMLIDREGNYWLASEGVHRLQGRTAWTSHTHRQNLPSNSVWNVHRSRDGVLWAGTIRGLARSTDKEWQVVPGTGERSIYAFAEDDAGNFWVGGNNPKEARNALLMRPAGSAAFVPVPLEHLLGPSAVNSMAFGPDGALYLGTQSHGVRRVARAGAGYREQAVVLPKPDPKEMINQVMRDPKGGLWVAGMGGLAFFDGTAWRRYGLADGLRDLGVECMAIDPAGGLLIGYYNVKGLTRFTLNATGVLKASQVDQPAALVADNIYSLGFDRRGALWMGTGQGVKRYADGRLDQFGSGEGLPSEDAASNAFWADANGDVWFGMASGIAHYHALAEQAAPAPPATRVLKVEDGAGKVLADAIPNVAWQDRSLTFRFAVLSYVNEAKLRAQVRLSGFEDSWRDTGVREARYTGLPPGTYRFEVRASLGGTEFGQASARDVVILAPWWRTGWAIAAALLGGAALVFLFLRWRLGWLRRRNAELQELVRARTDALENANGALEKANAALQEASMVDPLTGLKNRRFLGLSMPDELARVSRLYRARGGDFEGGNHTLLFFMIDLDHFKSVNDTYGHAVGDQILQQASAALRKACRDADFVVRWGGEEFLIVARNADRQRASVLADHLREAVRALRFDVGHGVVLEKTCSIGFAAFPVIESAPDAHPWEDVVKMADQCLYAAKNSGRDAWVGLVLSTAATDAGARMATELGALAAEGKVSIISSFPDTTTLRWQ